MQQQLTKKPVQMDKQEEILKGNKLMAEFMGFTVFHKRYPRNHGIGAPEAEWKDMIVEKAKYHTSWDWLMPVVEKIEKINHITDEADWGTYSFNLHDTYTSFGYGRFRIGTAIS